MRGDRLAVGMPIARHRHVLNRALFAIGQFDLRLLLANAWTLSALWANFRWADAGSLTTNRAWLRRFHFAHAGILAALVARLRLWRFTVPFRISEMLVRLHEI